jgi:amino acid transporter
MSLKHEHENVDLAEGHPKAAPAYDEPTLGDGEHKHKEASGSDPEDPVALGGQNKLHQDLKGRHMQMIAM